METFMERFLNGMEVGDFFFFLAMMIAGAFLYLCWKIYRALDKNPKTPSKFSWKFVGKGLVKLVFSAILLPIIVTHWVEAISFLVKTGLSLPKELDMMLEIKTIPAILTGFFIHIFVHRVLQIKSLDKVISKLAKPAG